MNLGLINSAFAQAGRDTRFGLEKTKEIGFDTVDIFTDPLDDNNFLGSLTTSSGELILGELVDTGAGAGGGAGGDAVRSATFPLVPFTVTGDEKGSGGGGAGGGLKILAIGGIVIGVDAMISAVVAGARTPTSSTASAVAPAPARVGTSCSRAPASSRCRAP